MTVSILHVDSPEQYTLCLEIRRKVFIEEQNVPERLEVDSFEESGENFLLFVDRRPVATGRFRIKDKFLKFERLATLIEARGRGYGKALMVEMQKFASKEYPQHQPITTLPTSTATASNLELLLVLIHSHLLTSTVDAIERLDIGHSSITFVLFKIMFNNKTI